MGAFKNMAVELEEDRKHFDNMITDAIDDDVRVSARIKDTVDALKVSVYNIEKLIIAFKDTRATAVASALNSICNELHNNIEFLEAAKGVWEAGYEGFDD